MKGITQKYVAKILYYCTGSRCTFEFPSRVPVCTVPSSMDRTSRYNKVDVVRLQVEFTFTEGSGVHGQHNKGRPQFGHARIKGVLWLLTQAFYLLDEVYRCAISQIINHFKDHKRPSSRLPTDKFRGRIFQRK